MTTPVAEKTRRAPRKRAADYTGKLTERLQEEKKAEVLEAAQRVALVNAEAREEKNILVDYTDDVTPHEVEVREAEVSTPYRIIRVNADIDKMTFGRIVLDPGDYDNPDLSLRRPAVMGPMRYYDFEEGRPYKVTKDVADHLNNIGYIAYMGGA